MRLFLIALAVIYAILILFTQTLNLGGERPSVLTAEKTENATFTDKPVLETEHSSVENAVLTCSQSGPENASEDCDSR